MDGEDFSDRDYYDIFLGIPETLNGSLQNLLSRANAVQDSSNAASNDYTSASEAQRQKTIDSVLKLYSDTIPSETWINFQRAAANLHRMHSLVKTRMNHVFRTSFEQGYIKFSTKFVRNVKRVSQNVGYNRSLPLESIRPLITSSSDPPLGTIGKRRRMQPITARRRPKVVSRPSPLQFSYRMLPNPISNDAESLTSVTQQMQMAPPSESDDICNCSSCSSSSSSSSTTSSEVDF